MFQGNYFGKGNTTTYDRGQFHPVTAPETSFVKYAVNWTQESTTWLINDAPVRTLMFADAVGGKNYPQTPMNIRLGNWVAGAPGNSPGTIQWAGGLADFTKGPFNMYVQSLKVVNYNPATSYAYNDMSGTFQSISALGAPPTASLSTSSGDTNSTGPGEVPFNGNRFFRWLGLLRIRRIHTCRRSSIKIPMQHYL
jgi:beta-glucanase (GH16 family)